MGVRGPLANCQSSASPTSRWSGASAIRSLSPPVTLALGILFAPFSVARRQRVLVLLEQIELLGRGQHRDLLLLPVVGNAAPNRQLLRAAIKEVIDEAEQHPCWTGDAADGVGVDDLEE